MRIKYYMLLGTLMLMTNCNGQNKNAVIIDELNNYILQNQEFINSNGQNLELRNKLELFSTNELPRLLKEIENITCNSKFDKQLISKYLEFLSRTKNSANEEPYIVFVSIFNCQQEHILNMIKRNHDCKFLFKMLEYYGALINDNILKGCNNIPNPKNKLNQEQ